MIFYFDRETGKRVSKSTWTRSESHGGTRYVRRSTAKPSQPAKEKPSKGKKAPAPSKAPRTWKEYLDVYENYEETDEEIEIETSVDY